MVSVQYCNMNFYRSKCYPFARISQACRVPEDKFLTQLLLGFPETTVAFMISRYRLWSNFCLML